MKEFIKQVANNFKPVESAPPLELNLMVQTLGLVSAANKLVKAAEKESAIFPRALREYEITFEQLHMLLGLTRDFKDEPDDEPMYTLPALVELTTELSTLVYNRIGGKTTSGNSLVVQLQAIEKCLVNFYVVYNRAYLFNHPERESIQRIDIVMMKPH